MTSPREVAHCRRDEREAQYVIQMFILLQRGLTLEERYRDPRERGGGERSGRLLVCGVWYRGETHIPKSRYQFRKNRNIVLS
jgi:hypothetical protein